MNTGTRLTRRDNSTKMKHKLSRMEKKFVKLLYKHKLIESPYESEEYDNHHLPNDQSYRGQLKMKASVTNGNLAVQIFRAKQLSGGQRDYCNTYVKLSLVPDMSKKTNCRSDVQRGTRHPVYDEKFTFELIGEDFKKRLLVSVWNKHPKRDDVDFLGCMSFSIRSLVERKLRVKGWYYLLSETTGVQTYLNGVSTRNPRSAFAEKFRGRTVPTEMNTVLLVKGTDGYGFSMSGASPAFVQHVKYDSAAYRAGLREGDQIVGVGGETVHKMASASVARIIRHHKTKVSVDFIRPTPMSHFSDAYNREYLESSSDESEDETYQTPQATPYPNRYSRVVERVNTEASLMASLDNLHITKNTPPFACDSRKLCVRLPRPGMSLSPEFSPELLSHKRDSFKDNIHRDYLENLMNEQMEMETPFFYE